MVVRMVFLLRLGERLMIKKVTVGSLIVLVAKTSQQTGYP